MFLLGKRVELSVPVLGKFSLYYRVIIPVYECVVGLLVLQYAQFGIHIILHLVTVAVHVVGCYVQQYRHIGAELIHVVELETAELNNVVILVAFGNLQCQTLADVACKSNIKTRLAEYMIYERGCGCLTVASCDAHHLGIGVASCKLDFRYHRYSCRCYLYYYGRFVGDSRALYYLRSIEDEFLGVLLLLPRQVVAVEQLLVFVGNRAEVRYEYVKPQFLGKDGCSATALSCTQNNNSLFHLSYL